MKKNVANSMLRIITDADFRFLFLAKYGFLNWLNDKSYISRLFKISFNTELNLDNPQTFNEKLQWLKLYDRKPIYTQMVDKYAAKDYVSSIIGEQYIIPTLGVWDRVDDIDFEALPIQFVLKCTHDSHGVVICRDKNKLNIEDAKKKLNKCLKQNYYLKFREWPYKNVKPRIIAEQYMEDSSTKQLRDYKFFCFNGVAKCYKVDFDRFVSHHANYFDLDGKLLKIGEEVCPPNFEKDVKTSDNLRLMKELAEKLTSEVPFLRADFYDVDGKVYFGELTFYPASGFGKFIYEGNDELFGSWLKLTNLGGVLYYS